MTDETFDADSTSPYASPDSKKFHEAAERALDHHFKPAVEPRPKRETGLFSLSPGTDAEALMCQRLGRPAVYQRHRLRPGRRPPRLPPLGSTGPEQNGGWGAIDGGRDARPH